MSKREESFDKSSSSGNHPTVSINNNVTNKNNKYVRQIFQNFRLIWLDTNINSSHEKFQKSIEQLQKIVPSITNLTDIKECLNILMNIKNEKVFLIVSGTVIEQLIEAIKMNNYQQLDSIYILCDNTSNYNEMMKKVNQVKGIYTNIESICKDLKKNCRKCDRTMISMSFDEFDPLFMCTQIFKETFLQIEENSDKSIKSFVEYCRSNEVMANNTIELFENEYQHHTPIWWYTGPYDIYSTLNYGLRIMDVDILLKMGFFIRDLHRNLLSLYEEPQSNPRTAKTNSFQVYRGQGLSLDTFEKFKKSKLMSFNNFLSTSRNRQVAQLFAESSANDSNLIGVIFTMTINPTSSAPFVDVKNSGYLEDIEEEILFSTHTIFQIDDVRPNSEDQTGRLFEIDLTLIENNSNPLSDLTSHLCEEFHGKGWSRIGIILLAIGQPSKAKDLYNALLNETDSNEEKARCNHQLGTVHLKMAQYPQTLSFYERSIEIGTLCLPSNHPHMASSYSNIGVVYYETGKYSNALEYYNKALKIQKIPSNRNHSRLSATYSNIGMVYYTIGNYSKAISNCEKALKIREKILSSNHPNIADSYLNIGTIYRNNEDYDKSMFYYKKTLEIQKTTFSQNQNHKSLADSYNNMRIIYDHLGNYTEAILNHKQAFKIQKSIFPKNHTSLADSHHKIANVE